MKKLGWFTTLCLGLVLAGCGSKGQDIDQNYAKKSEDRAKMMRSMFDASNHAAWEALPADQQKKVVDAYDGDKDGAKIGWDSMAKPMLGGGGSAPVPQAGQ